MSVRFLGLDSATTAGGVTLGAGPMQATRAECGAMSPVSGAYSGTDVHGSTANAELVSERHDGPAGSPDGLTPCARRRCHSRSPHRLGRNDSDSAKAVMRRMMTGSLSESAGHESTGRHGPGLGEELFSAYEAVLQSIKAEFSV